MNDQADGRIADMIVKARADAPVIEPIFGVAAASRFRMFADALEEQQAEIATLRHRCREVVKAHDALAGLLRKQRARK